MTTLHARFDPRRNGFDVLRLGFSLLVAVTHGLEIHTGDQPRWGRSALGDFGLDGFFILSGFLVTRSFIQLDAFPRFVWHRFLRIMPGFWVCIAVVALVVAPAAALLQGLSPATAFTEEPSALRYLLMNSGLLIGQYDIAGILAGTPEGGSFNGALWTLFFEAGCYGLVALTGVLGVLSRRRWVVVALGLGLLVVTMLQEAGVPVWVNERLLRLTFVFVIGMLAYLYASRIPLRVDLLMGSVAVFAVSVAVLDDYRALGGVPLAYVFFWFATWERVAWSMRHDLSYGMYIYHWPVLQLLVVTGASALPTAAFVVLGVAATVLPAMLSWLLIERPALTHKNSRVPERIAGSVLGLLGIGSALSKTPDR